MIILSTRIKSLLFLAFSVVIIFQKGMGQTTACGTVEAGTHSECQAGALDVYTGICGGNSVEFVMTNIPGNSVPICGGANSIYNNPSYFAFMANGEDYFSVSVTVIPGTCNNNQGIQAALLHAQDCDSFDPVGNCFFQCTQGTFTMTTEQHPQGPWIPPAGTIIIVMLDGCNGDICTVNFTINSGWTNDPDRPDDAVLEQSILTTNDNMMCGLVNFYVSPEFEDICEYIWHFPNGQTMYSDGPQITVNVSDWPDGVLCVQGLNEDCFPGERFPTSNSVCYYFEGVELEAEVVAYNTECDLDNGILVIYPWSLNGTAPYNITWNFSTTDPYTIQNRPPGTYNVVIIDQKLCKFEGTYIIEDSGPLEITNIDIQNTDCDNNSGAITVDHNGDINSHYFEYIWTPTNFNAPQIAPLSAGTYTLVIRNGSVDGCETDPIQIEVEVEGNTPVNIVSTAPSNCGEFSGEIVFNATGVGPFSYILNGPGGPYSGNGTTITGLPAGQFTLTVDDNGSVCESLPVNVLIPGTVGPDIEAGADQSYCGVLSASLSGIVSAGNAEWQQVSGPSTAVFSDATNVGSTITVTEYGVYVFRLTGEVDGCDGNPDEVTIEFNESPSVVFSELCDLDEVLFEGEISRGTGPYVFTSNNTLPGDINGGIITGTGINPGINYNVQVQDDKGCLSPVYALNHSGAPVLDGPQQQIVLGCDDGDEGNVLIEVDGETSPDTDYYSFVWDVASGGGTIVGTNNYGEYTGEGVYRLIVSKLHSGCQDTILVDVIVDHEEPDVDIPDYLVIDCTIDLPLEVRDISGTVNVSHSWSTLDGNIVSDNGSWIELDDAGTYTLIVTDTNNNCQATAELVVEDQRSVPDLSVVGDMVFNCFDNGADTILVNTEVENANIIWTSATPEIVESFDGTQLIVNGGGTIQIIIEDLENGCKDTTVVVIDSELDTPDYTADAGFTLDCVSGLDTSLNVYVGGNIQVSWSTTNGLIRSGSEDPRVNITGGGEYVYVITDPDNGCSVTGSINIGIDADLPEVYVDEELLYFYCSTDEYVLNATSNVGGGETYSWAASSGGNIVGPDDQSSVIIDAPGIYTVYVTNPANNCVSSKNVVVEDRTQSPDIEVEDDKTLTCFDNGEITVSGSSNTDVTYNWTDQDGNSYPANPTITVNQGGTYTLTVIDNISGCTASAFVIINEDLDAPEIELPAGPTITCFTEGEGVIVQPVSLTSGAETTWSTSVSGGLGDTGQDGSFTALKPGIFNVQVFDPANGCISTNSIEVFGDFEKPDVDAGVNQFIDCREPEATLTGSSATPGAIYLWNTNNGVIESNPNQSTIQVTGTGTYTLTIQDPNNGCTESDNVEVISLVEEPHVEAGPDIVLGCGEFSIVQQTGRSNTPGVEFLWSTTNGNIIGDVSSPVISIDRPGNYVLEVTDPNTGCSSRDFFVATNTTDLPVADAGEMQELTCSVETVTLNGTGSTGNNLVYTWTKVGDSNPLPGANNPVISVTTAGTYLLTVVNTANGCSDQDQVVVFAQEDVLSDIMIDARDISCFGQNDGSIQILQLVGGVAPFEVRLNGQSVGDVRNFGQLIPGQYVIEVSDVNGCKVSKPVIIDEPGELTSSLGSDITIKKGDGLTLNLIYGGGSGVQTIIWDTLGVEFCENCISVHLDPSRSMTVNVTVIDSSGCISQSFMRITVERDIHVYVPNVIAPKKDNNNLLTIYAGKQVVSVESFTVFDRWGNYLYKDENFSPNDDLRGWDGTYNGKFVTSGVYVYAAQVLLDDGTKRVISGDVTVLY